MDNVLKEQSAGCSATSLAPGCCGILQLCKPGFVAVNTIHCDPSYVDRFRELFCNRAGAIDRMLGFLGMYVLEPVEVGGGYLVISHWVDEQSFTAWTGSDEFLEGHRRAFQDLKEAKERGEEPPMKSDFKTYRLLTT
jgi:heme-degrading monooxygenase HmoA